ncbi:UNVERIFIED_CONTAM: Pentatricopeptide repeat-containing protein, chloroplastic [Sesamum angustifolium]|uniref:Pentatricopeptide repeat-containing protein, chloroplastic n=1 Tax=Sesamum angustifolium TaxID=2727405 RepID=A0AAW2QCW8_9LAMI
MAKALLSFHLHSEHTISQCHMVPAKTRAAGRTQNHESRIKHHNSMSSTTSVDRRQVRRVENSVPSVRRLLSCVNSGCLETAFQMFDTMNKSSTFLWNVMIRGLVNSGLFAEAIEFYCRMQTEGIKADNFTFPFVIKACAGVFGLKEGQKVHSTIIKLGFDVDIYICNALIVLYAKVGCIEDSEKVFECMPVRDLVSWNSMISGYVSVGDGWSSLIVFREMQKFGLKLDKFSYISALGACALDLCLLSGKEILCKVLRNGLELDSMIQSSLIDLFGKCGEVDYCERFFNRISQKNVVVWNAMIGSYVLNDESLKSFACLEKMQGDDNVRPDAITLINLLPACPKLGAFLHGKAIHGHAIRNRYLPHLILDTALVDMYGKCGRVALAKYVFFHMKERNLISWNAMIAAYMRNSKNREAIETFRCLQHEPCEPDEMTFTSVLAAYSEIALPKEGKQIHCHIYKLGISSGTFISNAMVHMYAKCGDLEAARNFFDHMLFKEIISWNTIIMAYAVHGFGAYCFRLFSDMMNDGMEPNGSTFVSVLSACSIAGLVDEGWKYFGSMKSDYGLDPGIEHYGCMLDLLGRVGNLDQAKRFIEEMPLTPTSRIWGSLLVASRHHRNLELAEMAASRILSLDTDNTGCYVLLSNMYAEVGRWEDVDRVRYLLTKQGLERTTGCSIVECNGKTYKFTNHDRSQTESNIIYAVLDILSRKVGEDPYVHSAYKFKPPDLLRRRDNSPMCHSVRLAICFGLIGTSIGEPVVIRKNIRICEDCHRATKRISEITNREIVVGDPKIYHHFKDGRCSCGDYW